MPKDRPSSYVTKDGNDATSKRLPATGNQGSPKKVGAPGPVPTNQSLRGQGKQGKGQKFF